MKPYRKYYKETADRDFLLAMASTLLVGCMLGATIAMGVMSL